MAELSNLQYELSSLMFGKGTDYIVSKVDFGDPALDTSDKNTPRSDSIKFGRDRRRGRLITFDIVLNIHPSTMQEGPSALAAFMDAWSGDSVRDDPEAVLPLRMNRHGQMLRVYGRPRRAPFVSGAVERGYVPITADFQCKDHLFYSDEEFSNTLSIVPPSTGGISAPVSAPVSTTGTGEKVGEITIGGTVPAWLDVHIDGPINNPEVDALGHWDGRLLTTIPNEEYVRISSYPWDRGVLRNGTANIAGLLSTRLSNIKLPPGDQQVVLRGTDVTGTASMTVKWRNAYRMFQGSVI